MSEHKLTCRLDEQQCREDCEHKNDRVRCSFTYYKHLEPFVKELAKQSTAPDKETPDWLESDIRRGLKYGYSLASKTIDEKDEFWNSLQNFHICRNGIQYNYGTVICSMCGSLPGINLMVEKKHFERMKEYFTQQASTIAALTEDKNNLFRLTEIRRKEVDKLILELGKTEAENERLKGLIELAHCKGWVDSGKLMLPEERSKKAAESWFEFISKNNL